MKRKISVGLVLLGMALSCSALGERIISKELIFERAIVNIEIDDDYVFIRGEFFIKNYSDATLFLVGFPFHIDEYMFPPSTIEVFLDNTTIAYEEANPDTIVFKVNIGKFERKSIIILYSQRLSKKRELRITYVTTSIRAWDKPLKNEKFIIKISKKYTIKEISLPVKEIKEQDEFVICYIDIDNFYPDNDLVVNLVKYNGGEKNE